MQQISIQPNVMSTEWWRKKSEHLFGVFVWKTARNYDYQQTNNASGRGGEGGWIFHKKEKKKEVNLIYLVVTAAKIYYLILKDQYLAML